MQYPLYVDLPLMVNSHRICHRSRSIDSAHTIDWLTFCYANKRSSFSSFTNVELNIFPRHLSRWIWIIMWPNSNLLIIMHWWICIIQGYLICMTIITDTDEFCNVIIVKSLRLSILVIISPLWWKSLCVTTLFLGSKSCCS